MNRNITIIVSEISIITYNSYNKSIYFIVEVIDKIKIKLIRLKHEFNIFNTFYFCKIIYICMCYKYDIINL